ncbi:mCG1036993, isoform CRA_b, partial [Mus musculus]
LVGKGAQPLPHIPPSLLPVFGIAELLPGSKSRLLEVEEGYNLQTWNLRRKNQPAKVAAEHARDC